MAMTCIGVRYGAGLAAVASARGFGRSAMVMAVMVPEVLLVRLRAVLAVSGGDCPHRLQRQQER